MERDGFIWGKSRVFKTWYACSVAEHTSESLTYIYRSFQFPRDRSSQRNVIHVCRKTYRNGRSSEGQL